MIDEQIINTQSEYEAPKSEPENTEINEDITSDNTAMGDEPTNDSADGPAVDYAAIAAADLVELKEQFPELSEYEDITEIDNPLRYAALRDLGLTPREAYLATNERHRRIDNRAHLSTAVPKGAGVPRGGMSREELYRARELFGNMSDAELHSLYRKVNA